MYASHSRYEFSFTLYTKGHFPYVKYIWVKEPCSLVDCDVQIHRCLYSILMHIILPYFPLSIAPHLKSYWIPQLDSPTGTMRNTHLKWKQLFRWVTDRSLSWYLYHRLISWVFSKSDFTWCIEICEIARKRWFSCITHQDSYCWLCRGLFSSRVPAIWSNFRVAIEHLHCYSGVSSYP